jgi:hypothetical protein
MRANTEGAARLRFGIGWEKRKAGTASKRPEEKVSSWKCCGYLKELRFVEFAGVFPLRLFLGAIKTLAALAAAIGTKRQEEQNPKFQNAPALGAMHVVAAAQRTISVLGVGK